MPVEKTHIGLRLLEFETGVASNIDDTGQLEQLVGYATRTALNLDGSTFQTMSPVWVDYVPSYGTNLAPNPLIFTRGPNLPVVSQWRPPKPTAVVTGPPTPYKPAFIDCMTGPNDAVEKMVENTAPLEHDPNQAAAVTVTYQNSSRGDFPVVAPETVEKTDGASILFSGFLNWLGCMANIF